MSRVRYAGDPSLRLKSGFAQDDTFTRAYGFAQDDTFHRVYGFAQDDNGKPQPRGSGFPVREELQKIFARSQTGFGRGWYTGVGFS